MNELHTAASANIDRDQASGLIFFLVRWGSSAPVMRSVVRSSGSRRTNFYLYEKTRSTSDAVLPRRLVEMSRGQGSAFGLSDAVV